jgi:hypothetical protein
MAMNLNSNTSSSSTAKAGDNPEWKSQYFLNFAIPAHTATGKLTIGGVGLKVSDPAQKGMIDFLLADAANVDRVRKSLVITFRDMSVASAAIVVNIPGVVMPVLAPVEVDETKPQGYLNFHCPMADGSEGQVGFIALREKDPAHRVLLAILRGGAENVAAVVGSMLMDFRSATPAKRTFAFA